MRLVSDLHIHSRHSLATSPKLLPTYLDRWASIKGIDLLGTGDCTHPAWLARLKDELEPAEGEGFFRLKAGLRRDFAQGEALAAGLPEPGSGPGPRFVLTGEISTIYSKGGATRKVHHLVLLPDFQAATAFQARLERVGNISSDGRPILGLDSRDLLEILLEADPRSVLVPAHIWTPWFSALGARSGFDSIAECYGDLADHLVAIETGLSSNPPMNWAVASLDPYAIISNSDAHSPDKLGREATVFEMEDSFQGLARALESREPGLGVLETLEFFPQEGKYHWDGHRACGVVLDPNESAQRGGICPACGKPLTPGVSRRVAQLADRPVDEEAPCPLPLLPGNRRPYRSLIPLGEVLGEVLGLAPGSKKVGAAYASLISKAGSEFSILLEIPASDLASLRLPGLSGEVLAEALVRMRSGRVHIQAGYDGEYGVVRAFAPGEVATRQGPSGSLFAGEAVPGYGPLPASKPRPKAAKAQARPRPSPASPAEAPPPQGPRPLALDPSQKAAVEGPGGPTLVVAGPGSGKTAVLALRIAHLVRQGLAPASILGLTFTNKAGAELGKRIARSLEASGEASQGPWTGTFHAYCLAFLKEEGPKAGLGPGFRVLGQAERQVILDDLAPRRGEAKRLEAYIEARKRFLLLPGDAGLRLGPGAPAGLGELAEELGVPPLDPDLEPGYGAYREVLKRRAALDFEDLVAGTVRLLSARPELLGATRQGIQALFVDEYQDLNFAQYALVRLLAPQDLWVIGDPDQAIYGFRGSDRRLIERFLKDYPGAQVHRLAKSFRCPQPILGAAARLVGKDLTGNGQALTLERSVYPTDKSEAEGIAREIDRLIGGTRFFALDSGVAEGGAQGLSSLGECAILLRISALAPAFEKALQDHGLPYRLVGERPWWEAGAAAELLGLARQELSHSSLQGALEEAARILEEGPSANVLGQKAIREARDSLMARAVGFPDLGSFLDSLALGQAQDGLDPSRDRISLMTIHAAKGLEFDQVFIPALEEGILPFSLYDEASDPEEEKRLLYVAMTRAKKGLHLSWAKSRHLQGRGLEQAPSPFLGLLEDLVPQASQEALGPRDPQLGLF